MRKLWIILLAGWLGLQNGKLALWANGDPTPYQILPYRAETYSDTDRKALEDGIPFANDAQRSRVMEDYLS